MMGEPAGAGGRDRRDFAERIYDEARALPAAERMTYVEDACAEDDALREELCGLLAHAEAAEGFFERLGAVVQTAGSTAPVVAGRYEIHECIGAGGMGTVYRARDRRLQRDVALKFLPPHFADGQDGEEALLREARAAAALEHTNVCTVHEISTTDDGRPFISMAFYEGATLKERMRRGPIPLAEALGIGRQLARGLAAAHARGIVHRDVKPGNVMLLNDGTVKLLDFGLARLSDATVTAPGSTRGTVAYMSPEQARGDAVDARSDLFSLGVVLHEMIAGAHPFRGGNQHAVLQAILHEEPQPLRKLDPGAPPALERIVSRLLRKQPDARYADASALVADLVALSSTAAVSAREWFAWPPPRRTWLTVAAAFVVVAAGATALSVSSFGPAGATVRTAAAPAGRPSAIATKTIAVLPFSNLGRDSAEDYLVDGLSEELIAALSQVRSLRVVARTSAFAFKDARRDIREIGRALGVGTVLEGSVQRAGDHIRVRAQLINVVDGLHLWSEAYDSEVTDIFAVQRDLALRIANALEAGLSPAEQAHIGERPHVTAEAWNLYVKGRHFFNQRTSSSFVLAREYYQRSIEADSQFAAAYAGLATVYSLQGLWGDLPSSVARERMRAAATRAVQLDDGLAEAHSALGVYEHAYEWNPEAAEREQLRAIALNPELPSAHYFYGNLLRIHGRLDEALAQYRTSAELNPLDPLVGEALGRTLILAGRLDEAREYLLGAVELDSMFWWPHLGLGEFHETKGDLEEALREYRRAMELGGSKIHVARLLARTGHEAEAREMLGFLQAGAARTGIHPPEAATIFYALQDVDGAIGWLEQAYAERHPMLRFISGHPEFVPLEADSRYIDLLRRVGVRR